MGWPEAIVAIIIIVTIGRVMRSKYRAEHGDPGRSQGKCHRITGQK
jgi:hypothetical protein